MLLFRVYQERRGNFNAHYLLETQHISAHLKYCKTSKHILSTSSASFGPVNDNNVSESAP